MSYSFDEIMSYHPTNREVYNEIKRNLSCIVPFIGAGLTQFAYCSWKQALEKLAENIRSFVSIIAKSKPSVVKGTYIKNVAISTTMGPGIKIDTNSFDN